MFILTVVVALLSAISVYGIHLLAGKGSASVASTLIAEPLELKLELDKTEFEQGEPVNITVSLKNIGNTTIEVSYAYRGSKVMYKVLDMNDTEIYEYGRAILTMVDEISLAPDEQVSHTFTWNQVIWTYIWINGHKMIYSEEQAPRGTYKIVGATAASIGVVGVGPLGQIETPPITITIK